jgi:hypothetical protein
MDQPDPIPNAVGDGGPFTDSNEAGRKADYTASFNTEVQNEWSNTSTLPLILHGVCMENFIKTLITRYLSLIWCYNAE